MTQYTATSCGGLACGTCPCFKLPQADLETKEPEGVSGILTNHLRSNEHKAAVKGQQIKAAGSGLHAFLRPKPSAASEEQGGGAAAAASAAVAASSSAAAASTGTGKDIGSIWGIGAEREDDCIAQSIESDCHQQGRGRARQGDEPGQYQRGRGPTQVRTMDDDSSILSVSHTWMLINPQSLYSTNRRAGPRVGGRGGRGGRRSSRRQPGRQLPLPPAARQGLRRSTDKQASSWRRVAWASGRPR